jgi:hypothetical protein
MRRDALEALNQYIGQDPRSFRRVLITYSLRRFPILISSLALVVQQFNIKSYKGNGKSKRHSHL